MTIELRKIDAADYKIFRHEQPFGKTAFLFN